MNKKPKNRKYDHYMGNFAEITYTNSKIMKKKIHEQNHSLCIDNGVGKHSSSVLKKGFARSTRTVHSLEDQIIGTLSKPKDNGDNFFIPKDLDIV
jgi:hypothetical protein